MKFYVRFRKLPVWIRDRVIDAATLEECHAIIRSRLVQPNWRGYICTCISSEPPADSALVMSADQRATFTGPRRGLPR